MEKTIEYFRDMTNNTKLNLKVIEVNGNVLSVDMYDGNRESVCRQLCATGRANRRDRSFSEVSLLSNDVNPKTLWRSLSLDTTEGAVAVSWVEIADEIDCVDVCVSYITTSREVTVIMVGPEHHQKLEVLENVMTEHFENNDNTTVEHYEIGNHYAAFSDGSWYRVELVGFIDTDCEVMLVDHGNKTIVARSEMKEVPDKFLKLPFQAIPCVLEGVPTSCDPEILQYMTELVLGKVYIAFLSNRLVLFDTQKLRCSK